MGSAPPARSDDNPLEEAFTIGVSFDPGVVREREVDFASRGWGQRAERDRRTSAEGLICRRLCPLLELVGSTLLEAVAVKVYGAMIGEAPIQDSITKILESIEAAPSRSGQKMKIPPLELSRQGLLAVGKVGGDLEISGAK
jgi:hypothetical protein